MSKLYTHLRTLAIEYITSLCFNDIRLKATGRTVVVLSMRIYMASVILCLGMAYEDNSL
jgi:hypothetical protein